MSMFRLEVNATIDLIHGVTLVMIKVGGELIYGLGLLSSNARHGSNIMHS